MNDRLHNKVGCFEMNIGLVCWLVSSRSLTGLTYVCTMSVQVTICKHCLYSEQTWFEFELAHQPNQFIFFELLFFSPSMYTCLT